MARCDKTQPNSPGTRGVSGGASEAKFFWAELTLKYGTTEGDR